MCSDWQSTEFNNIKMQMKRRYIQNKHWRKFKTGSTKANMNHHFEKDNRSSSNIRAHTCFSDKPQTSRREKWGDALDLPRTRLEHLNEVRKQTQMRISDFPKEQSLILRSKSMNTHDCPRTHQWNLQNKQKGHNETDIFPKGKSTKLQE